MAAHDAVGKREKRRGNLTPRETIKDFNTANFEDWPLFIEDSLVKRVRISLISFDRVAVVSDLLLKK